MTPEPRTVEEWIALQEYQRRVEDECRRNVRRRRRVRFLKRAGLCLLVPVAGPLVGELWDEV